MPRFLAVMNDKFLHLIQYFLLFFFAVNAFRRVRFFWSGAHAPVYAFAYCLLVGVATECLQYYAPGRRPDFADWIADTAGAGGALALYSLTLGFWIAFRRSHPKPVTERIERELF